ncbi:MAG: hypothetical protein E6G85_29845 [Alphaproteobacteria bacterium]|nr:MAG: hypothetical protein E6G85_29845 [Alphaproteobacteria bacterium]
MNLISALSPAYQFTSAKRQRLPGAPQLVRQFNEFSEVLAPKCTYSCGLSMREFAKPEPAR